MAAHVGALRRHGVAPDVVLVQRGALPLGDPGVAVVEADVARPHGLAHDTAKLGVALAALTRHYRRYSARTATPNPGSSGLASSSWGPSSCSSNRRHTCTHGALGSGSMNHSSAMPAAW